MPTASVALARRILLRPLPFRAGWAARPQALARYDTASFALVRARQQARRRARAGYRRVREEPRLTPVFARLIAVRDRLR